MEPHKVVLCGGPGRECAPRIAIVPFEAAHLAALHLQAAQRPELKALPDGGRMAAERGPAFTAMAASCLRSADESRLLTLPGQVKWTGGRVIACAGLAENHAGYASAWALFGEGIGLGSWAALVGAIRRVLAASGYGRIDMLVRDGFGRAGAFAERLGFEREGLVRRCGADGSDFILYARVSHQSEALAGAREEEEGRK